jgi:GDPmannose 4,6-dehydratase
VLATGITTRIRDFVKMAFAEIGVEVIFEEKDEQETGKVAKCTGAYNLPEGKVVVRVDPRYYRPTEVDLLIGDASKAKKQLGWEPRYTLAEMVTEMVASDLELFKKEQFLKDSGYDVKNEFE